MHIIVQTMLLEQNIPVNLSFFFKEVFDVCLLLLYQSFEQLSIVDVQLLSMMTTDVVDLSIKLIGARMDATEERMKALKSNYFRSHQV